MKAQIRVLTRLIGLQAALRRHTSGAGNPVALLILTLTVTQKQTCSTKQPFQRQTELYTVYSEY